MNPNILVYTCLYGDYDHLHPLPFVPEKNTRYICYTDNADLQAAGWEIAHLPLPGLTPRRASRYMKINAHLLPEHDRSIYLDASAKVLAPLSPVASQIPIDADLATMAHFRRDCLYAEAVEVRKGLDKIEVVRAHMKRYRTLGFPEHFGLGENGCIVRRNNSHARRINELWWKEYQEGSCRDQLSLMFCLWQLGIPPRYLPVGRRNPYFTFGDRIRHKGTRYERFDVSYPMRQKLDPTTIKVHHSTPGQGDKNLGKAYNEECERAGPDDWICLRDGDTMFLTPFWAKQIEDIIARHGHEYDLISCYTNRLGMAHQLLDGEMADSNDLADLARIAHDLYDRYYDEVIPTTDYTAGLLMLFPRKTWEKTPFRSGLINADGNCIDFYFSDGVLKWGRVGLAKGLYIAHLYRLLQGRRDRSHLKGAIRG